LLSRSIVFDTSVLLNLLAAGQAGSIIRSVCSEGLICSAVASETLFIRSERIQDPPELVDLKPLLEAHILKICNLEATEEYDSYVEYAMDLDDGEAMSLAICAARGHAIATDDRKACQIAGRSPKVEVIGTPEIVQRSNNRIRSEDGFGTSGPVDHGKLAVVVLDHQLKRTLEWVFCFGCDWSRLTLQKIVYCCGHKPSLFLPFVKHESEARSDAICATSAQPGT
jgi:predicted nucleic acid-binding protein